MFTPPVTNVPQAKLDASKLLTESNTMLAALQRERAEAFRFFWYSGGVLRSKEEINAILAAMDEASPGQSARFFQAAAKLAEFILTLAPGSLGVEDWLPPYEYTVNPETFALRVV